MKVFFFTLFSVFLTTSLIGQVDSVKKNLGADTTQKVRSRPDTVRSRRLPPKQVSPATPLVADTLMPDTLVGISQTDTTRPDSVKSNVIAPAVKKYTGIDSAYARFLNHPFLPVGKKPVFQIANFRQQKDKDNLFYLTAGLVFLLAFIKLVFNRYYANIFRLFFQPSFRQKQTREQLMQSNLPSLLLNLFFIFSAGIYSALLAHHYGLLIGEFWLMVLYTTSFLLLLYAGKYIFITFSGWVFNVKEAADTYIFAVYLINKILGVILLPFIFILAFAQTSVASVSIVVSYLIIGLLFLYRYAVSMGPVRREMSVSSFHFMLYILAFEILPLLFICKSLILFMGRTL